MYCQMSKRYSLKKKTFICISFFHFLGAKCYFWQKRNEGMNERRNERRNEQRNEQTKEGRNEQTDKGTNKQEQKKKQKNNKQRKKINHPTNKQTNTVTTYPTEPTSARSERDECPEVSLIFYSSSPFCQPPLPLLPGTARGERLDMPISRATQMSYFLSWGVKIGRRWW